MPEISGTVSLTEIHTKYKHAGGFEAHTDDDKTIVETRKEAISKRILQLIRDELAADNPGHIGPECPECVLQALGNTAVYFSERHCRDVEAFGDEEGGAIFFLAKALEQVSKQFDGLRNTAEQIAAKVHIGNLVQRAGSDNLADVLAEALKDHDAHMRLVADGDAVLADPTHIPLD